MHAFAIAPFEASLIRERDGEEKSFRHVSMVAKFLDDNKPKSRLKVYSHYFKLHRSFSISFNLASLGEIFFGTVCNVT